MLFTRASSRSGAGRSLRPAHFTCSLLALALAGLLTSPAVARERPAYPAFKFQDKSRGAEAVRRLGARMNEVASWYGMTPERLSSILAKDKDAWLDERGRLLFIDSALPDEAGATDGSGDALEPGPYPHADTFKLHSKPGAKRIIYLDFDGHSVTGSAWNSGAAINALPFSLDADTSTNFSTTELDRIQLIWQRVAEDYAPFDVDVTTELPTSDLLLRTGSTDEYYGTRAVITDSSIGVCTGCGGVAYVGVFDWYSSSTPAYYQPAWVLYDRLGSGNEKYVAEAISHEVGHNLGLSHDGTSTQGYYSGHGSGTSGWAPIMGVGYNQPIVQFSKGEYADANNKEDDFQVIQTNGAPLKVDVVGNAASTAVALTGAVSGGVTTINRGGVIETATDADYFSVAPGAGVLQITATPGLRSPNLDLSLQLFDAAGNSVALAQPTDSLAASINVSVPAGSYFLRVKGTGLKDPLNTGYSEYGSVGRYMLKGSYTASSFAAPQAVINASPVTGYAPLETTFSSAGSSDADGAIVSYAWDFGDGSRSTEPHPLHTYTVAGNYTARLTVTDSQGLTGTASVPVTVTADMAATTMRVDAIALSLQTTRSGKTTYYRCVGNVTVKNQAGTVGVSGASVTANWSGVTSSKAIVASTGTNGIATFSSPRTTARGTCTLGVTGVSLSGWTYSPSSNVVTSRSLTY